MDYKQQKKSRKNGPKRAKIKTKTALEIKSMNQKMPDFWSNNVVELADTPLPYLELKNVFLRQIVFKTTKKKHKS